jgi:DNA-binding PadR family transcriptional regulator
MAKSKSPAPVTPASYQILLALAGRDRHGYAILKAVERQTEGGIRLGPGTLYAAIRRLEDEGLIAESGWRPDPDLDDERRRYYALTRAGRAVLVAETERLQALVRLARRTLAEPVERPS